MVVTILTAKKIKPNSKFLTDIVRMYVRVAYVARFHFLFLKNIYRIKIFFAQADDELWTFRETNLRTYIVIYFRDL